MAEDAISIGGVDLADVRIYAKGVPYEAFGRLRERAPVAWHPYKDGPGFLALPATTRSLPCPATAPRGRRRRRGCTSTCPVSTTAPICAGLMMLTMDPPRHTALRALVSKGFTPRQVAKLNERISDMARDVVDSVIERGECDFANDVAGALPSYVIAELLGVPLEDGVQLYELTEIMNRGRTGRHPRR